MLRHCNDLLSIGENIAKTCVVCRILASVWIAVKRRSAKPVECQERVKISLCFAKKCQARPLRKGISEQFIHKRRELRVAQGNSGERRRLQILVNSLQTPELPCVPLSSPELSLSPNKKSPPNAARQGHDKRAGSLCMSVRREIVPRKAGRTLSTTIRQNRTLLRSIRTGILIGTQGSAGVLRGTKGDICNRLRSPELP